MIHLALWLVSAAIVLIAGGLASVAILAALVAVANDMRERPRSWYGLSCLLGGVAVLYLAALLNDASGSATGEVFALALLAFALPLVAVVLYRTLMTNSRAARV